jgi:predicted RNA binding protein YcfA (HicA-like mRNA interferase family)
MRLPRDLTGVQLIRALGKLGYQATRQSGSHVRLTCTVPVEHHVTVPLHDPLRIGTLAGILAGVAESRSKTRDEIVIELFG